MRSEDEIRTARDRLNRRVIDVLAAFIREHEREPSAPEDKLFFGIRFNDWVTAAATLGWVLSEPGEAGQSALHDFWRRALIDLELELE